MNPHSTLYATVLIPPASRCIRLLDLEVPTDDANDSGVSASLNGRLRLANLDDNPLLFHYHMYEAMRLARTTPLSVNLGIIVCNLLRTATKDCGMPSRIATDYLSGSTRYVSIRTITRKKFTRFR